MAASGAPSRSPFTWIESSVLTDLGLRCSAATPDRWRLALSCAVKARSREQVARAMDRSLPPGRRLGRVRSGFNHTTDIHQGSGETSSPHLGDFGSDGI